MRPRFESARLASTRSRFGRAGRRAARRRTGMFQAALNARSLAGTAVVPTTTGGRPGWSCHRSTAIRRRRSPRRTCGKSRSPGALDGTRTSRTNVAAVRKQYHFRPSAHGLYAWDVHRLIDLTAELSREDVPLVATGELRSSVGRDQRPGLRLCQHATCGFRGCDRRWVRRSLGHRTGIRVAGCPLSPPSASGRSTRTDGWTGHGNSAKSGESRSPVELPKGWPVLALKVHDRR